MLINGCFALPDTNSFIQIEGKNSMNIAIKGNDLVNAKYPVRITDVQFSSCRRMCVGDYICGHTINVGEILGE